MRCPTTCIVTADTNKYLRSIDADRAAEDLEAEMHNEAYSEVWATLQGHCGKERGIDMMEDLLIEVEWDDVVQHIYQAFNTRGPETEHWRTFLTPFINKKINQLAEEKCEKFVQSEIENRELGDL